jgi:hypothetical protein
MNDQNITDEYINDSDVERMADDLAVDEMYSLSYADLQFVLKDLLRDKYLRMQPTELYQMHRDRFYYTYSEEVTYEV